MEDAHAKAVVHANFEDGLREADSKDEDITLVWVVGGLPVAVFDGLHRRRVTLESSGER